MQSQNKIAEAKVYKWILYLIALHSIIVGISLIALPPEVMWIFGYSKTGGRFFQMQGGLFHLIMALVYYYSGKEYLKNIALIKITIAAKYLAFLFLILFFFTIEDIWVVFFSGIADFLMGTAVLILYRISLLTHEK